MGVDDFRDFFHLFFDHTPRYRPPVHYALPDDLISQPCALPNVPYRSSHRTDTWNIDSEELPELKHNEFAIKIELISLDPAMRGWLDDRPSYLPPVEIGAIMRAGSLGTIIESKNQRFPVGAQVVGNFGATEIAISDGTGARLIKPDLAPAPMFLGALGMTGMTAYFGFFELGVPRAGDTVVVSAAAGAVGSIVGQLAKINGCTVIGIAGGKDKCDYVTGTLGFDVLPRLQNRCPHAQATWSSSPRSGFTRRRRLFRQRRWRNSQRKPRLPFLRRSSRDLRSHLSVQRDRDHARAQQLHEPAGQASPHAGFLVFDYEDKFPVAQRRIGKWLAQGKITAPETIVKGEITEFPRPSTASLPATTWANYFLQIN